MLITRLAATGYNAAALIYRSRRAREDDEAGLSKTGYTQRVNSEKSKNRAQRRSPRTKTLFFAEAMNRGAKPPPENETEGHICREVIQAYEPASSLSIVIASRAYYRSRLRYAWGHEALAATGDRRTQQIHSDLLTWSVSTSRYFRTGFLVSARDRCSHIMSGPWCRTII